MIDATGLQENLLHKGYSIGVADGVIGPRTLAALAAYVAGRDLTTLLPIGKGMARYLPEFGLLDTAPRLANFIGQTCHESGGYRFLREIWGPTPTQRRYEGRRDLGNTQAGDGKRYMGRGILQITGRANYTEMAMRTGEPLVDQPELAERPDIAVLTACIFWRSRKINLAVDAGQEDKVTRIINGGTNGIEDRRELVAKARGIIP
jgi:putative chitinase